MIKENFLKYLYSIGFEDVKSIHNGTRVCYNNVIIDLSEYKYKIYNFNMDYYKTISCDIDGTYEFSDIKILNKMFAKELRYDKLKKLLK